MWQKKCTGIFIIRFQKCCETISLIGRDISEHTACIMQSPKRPHQSILYIAIKAELSFCFSLVRRHSLNPSLGVSRGGRRGHCAGAERQRLQRPGPGAWLWGMPLLGLRKAKLQDLLLNGNPPKKISNPPL
jgi:hypothetical protein